VVVGQWTVITFTKTEFHNLYYSVNISWIFRKWDVDWIELAQDRDRWQALVTAVMKLREISCLAEKPVSFLRTLLHGVNK
jgi:hypothetical protein